MTMPPTSKAPSDAIHVGPLAQRIGYMLRRAHKAVLDHGNVAFGRINLRPPQYGILLFLAHSPGRNQAAVGAALGIQRSNFVGLIKGLDKRKLVRRSRGPKDKRPRVLHLTNRGEALLREAKKIDAKLDRRFDKKLGRGGREKLLELLTKRAEPDTGSRH
jgi:DNA-binding MarR family transcriptional regulator